MQSATLCFLQVYVNMTLLFLTRLLDEPSLLQAHIPTTEAGRGNSNVAEGKAWLSAEQPALISDTWRLVDGRFRSRPSGDSILYLPALTALSLEVRCLTMRQRIAEILDGLSDAGFRVAGVALGDMKLAWGATTAGCGDFCLCSTTSTKEER
ncbi:hypothetical protein BDY17DRAFT_304171 [Neohortaea acidophila]|uniref:Uncharacterized protein n=1 Tax=Neohortaea acidophila TaxID=245834 RepID=A0A6A6PJV2_9PEZI|nr:uncharacterized protein BDY17DRAFT_304171 [Neohortaea acidophila]KAF2479547.1 hypothetical protein BDY17DRAFT_304171 [Neohortaea acidophila]